MPAELADEADAYLFLEQLRWDGAPKVCPHCAFPGRCYFLRPANGRCRQTRTGATSQRRVWKCGACRRQFSVLSATILQGTKVGVLTWIAMIADLAEGRLPGSSLVAADRYGVSPHTARHMLDRLRAASTVESFRSCMAGIDADGALRRGDGQARRSHG